jgi:phosphoribosylformylglycinamidine synthase
VQQPEATAAQASELGLSPEEFERITQLLGRTPNFTEMSMFSVMWSEHCCYKNSIAWLKTLPKAGKHILAEAGEENAGLVDIGDGQAVAFKIESHNHPSAIEPYQGAATGVGGIHRDIFTMGARPIAALNSLRFGELQEPQTKRLLKGVVAGIGDYGNSFGVPTVGGEIYFDQSYHVNPLINAMSVGLVDVGHTISATAKGVGNPVYIVGSATGKDGIHGASFASGDITEDSSEDLPSVQVGDPFQEKLLLEATLEAMQSGAVVGMQDMGAAGITCSTSEMADKGGSGMHVYLDQVPLRQQGMNAMEILLSESQERMLVVAEKGREEELEAVFDKWDLNCAIIGEVAPHEDGLNYYMHGEQVAHVPPDAMVLGGQAPVYDREVKTPEYTRTIAEFDIHQIPEPADLRAIGRELLANASLADKQWVTDQYDSMVQTNTMTTNRPSDAGVVRIKGTDKALALTTDCNAHYVFAEPRKGAAIAVAEAARNIVCSGGEPSAITNCLNFGNPLDPEVYWQFVNTIKGLTDACEQFDTPVTGGNVSFYNQSPNGGPVLPTPAIGMVGLMPQQEQHTTLDFKQESDIIYLIGPVHEDIGSSQYALHHLGYRYSPAPVFDLETEQKVQEAVKSLISEGLLQSAHDISEGGLFVSLVESAIPRQLGFQIATSPAVRKDAFLFGESQSRAVVTVKAEQADTLKEHLKHKGVSFHQIGQVKDHDALIDGEHLGRISELAAIYHESVEAEMSR